MSAVRGRRWWFLACLAVPMVVLVGCGPSSAPVWWAADEVRGVPRVGWPFGAPDVSDEWVAALYDANVALAVAQNAHDFSGELVAEHVAAEFATRVAQSAASGASHSGDETLLYPYMPGPKPITVSKVAVQGDRAGVTVCLASFWSGGYGPGQSVTSMRAEKRGGEYTYDLRREEDGRIRVYGFDSSGHGCDLSDLRLGYFEVEPPYGEQVLVREVLGADGEPAEDERYW